MPELPDLEVIREYLAVRVAGLEIVGARVPRPLVVRNVLGGDAADRLVGRRIVGVERRGKFLLLPLDDGTHVVINPMLAGRFRYGEPLASDRKRDALVLGLGDGSELRYHDAKDMGKVYLVADPAQVPTFAEQGPEATDPGLTRDVFMQRLKRHTGEIKGTLTNQAFVAGIGNAYADEICWQARIYPFRRRAQLNEEELDDLYRAVRTTLEEAIETLRSRVGEKIEVEIRDFLAVHGKEGEPCPRCGAAISGVTRDKKTTNFCRQCQPGLMVGGPGRRLAE
jgi:formamidopyrimidine-DNA glycosylase